MITNNLTEQTFLFPACNDFDHHYNLLGGLFKLALTTFEAEQVGLEYLKDLPYLPTTDVVNWYKEEEKIYYQRSWNPKPLKTGVLVVLDITFLN